jgi:MFS family permease
MSQPPALRAAAAIAAELSPDELGRLRRRTLWTLFAISALGSTGYIAAPTVGTLVAAEISGSAAFGGLPTTATTIGTAFAASLLAVAMLRIGRRAGLLAGLMLGVLGGVTVLVAVLVGSVAVLLAGSVLAGFANGASQLGRYVAADLFGPERRASAIGIVVWGSTIGAVAGPNLISPAGAVASSIGLPELAGAYGATILFLGAALVLGAVLLRPEPYALADPSALAARSEADGPAPSAMTVLLRPVVTVAIVTLVASQVVMVLIMTMTPLHLVDHGHGLATVGFVLSAHTFGMFALSPLSGRLTDRFGSPPVITAGLATLAGAALLSALAPPDGGTLLTVALFLLGYGWNLCFVAGSALLTRGLSLGERTGVQGVTDGMIWGSAAVASLSSGVVVAGASYAVLGLIGLALLIAPMVLLVARRALLAGRAT